MVSENQLKKKEQRRKEKEARKAANVAKVEATKAAKKAKEQLAKKHKSNPKPKKEVEVIKAKNIWELVEADQKGAVINHEEGTYFFPLQKDGSTSSGKARKVLNKNRPSRHRAGRAKPVCVEMADGKHTRVSRRRAEELVAKGGRFIPKHQFEGSVTDPETKQKVKVDWSHKK